MNQFLSSLFLLTVWAVGDAAASEPVTMVQVQELGDNLTADARLFEAELRADYNTVQSVIQYVEEEVWTAWDEATRDSVNCPLVKDVAQRVIAEFEKMNPRCEHVNELMSLYNRVFWLHGWSQDRARFLPRIIVSQALHRCRPQSRSATPCEQDPTGEMFLEFLNFKFDLAGKYAELKRSLEAKFDLVVTNCTRPLFFEDDVRNLLQPFLRTCNGTMSAGRDTDTRHRPTRPTAATEEPNSDESHL